MDTIREVQNAIERWVERNKPADADLRWTSRKPIDHWRFTETAWVTEFQELGLVEVSAPCPDQVPGTGYGGATK